MGEFVNLETDDGIGTIRLNRPKVNALNDQVTAELAEAARGAAASAAVTIRPLNTMSLARDGPTRRGSRCVPPAPGMTPSRISGWPTLARSPATRKSAARASSSPPPSA